MTDLEAQITVEQKQILEAQQVPVSSMQPLNSGMAGRCHWCGRISNNLVPVYDYGPLTPQGTAPIINERYKGLECCGGRHV
jgi:hypothetical protein